MADILGIIGLGSAGRRHARNAAALGLRVIGYDPNVSVREFSCDRTTTVDAILCREPLGIVIATPPDTHRELYRQCRNAAPLLMEKPLGTSTDEWQACSIFSGCHLVVGYQFRYMPSLRQLKADVYAGKYGTIFSAHVEFSSSAWCSATYEADFLLECSHEADAMRWMLGDPVGTWANVHGDVATGTMDFAGVQATFHLDGVSPDYRRRLVLYGTKGSVAWCFDHDENERAYVAELRDFLAVCRGEKAPECTGADGLLALKTVEAIKKSAGNGRWEPV